ncbi:MAG TPA: site-2 protease family protein [Anaerolineae bacterium]|nr:site-2 protease family protein [Anaerolineae bacterium]
MRGTWRIARIFGIDINIDSSWLIVFVLITWTLAGSYFPAQYPGWDSWLHWMVGVTTSVLFFASVLAHELAHSLVAIRQGEKVRSITLFIFGGVAQITKEPDRALKEFLMAIVGPLSSLAIALAFGILWLVVRRFSEPVGALARYLAIINASVALFNLIPGFPLDGGRVLRALIWGISGNLRMATLVASWFGQGIALLFMLWGVWQVFTGAFINGLWMAFIGWFLRNASISGYRQVIIRDMLRDVRVEDLMSRDFETVSPALTIQQIVDDYVLRRRDHAYPVADGDHLRGIICLHDVKAVPRQRWASTLVREVMTPWEKLATVSAEDDGNTVLTFMNTHNVGQLPVVEGDRVMGMLRRSDIIRFMQLRSELGI